VTTYDDAEVRAALRRVWPDAATVESAQIRALGGGLTPRTFLAVAGRRRHVLRLPTTRCVALLDLATEARAMRAAAAADLAPAVVAVDVDAGLLLTEYGPMPWTAELVRLPAAISAIVRLLHALHRLDVELPVYAVGGIAATYFAALEATGAAARSVEEQRWAAELARLGRHFDESYPPSAFCHNDLTASNILTDGAAARLIDFEYAGRGSPLLDLASLAGMNDFAEPQRRQLLDEYYAGAPAAPTLRELGNAIRMLRQLAYFWACVAQQRTAEPAAFATLAASIGATLRQD
jgi:aminoglycoside phosphotransferase (APT) family kinase protein